METYNLLIIDHDPNIRGLLNELLAGRPEFGILIAADGKEAARQLIANRVDIILADIHMPGFTGLELMASLTTLPSKPEILVMSENTRPEDIETARRLGARGMLQKPFDDLEKVEMQINKALAAARAAHHPGPSPAVDPSGPKAAAGAPKPPLWPAPKGSGAPMPAPGASPGPPKSSLGPAPNPVTPAPVSATPTPAVHVPAAASSQPAAKGPAVRAPNPATPPPSRGATTAQRSHETAHPVPSPAAPAPPRQEAGRSAPHEAPEEAIPDLPSGLEAVFRAATSLDTRKLRMQVPIVCLQTWEEKGAIASLRRLAASLHREFYVWTAARGLLKDGAQPMGDIYGDAVRALEFIRRQKNNGLYILADFRSGLEDEKVVRVLREMVMEQDTARQMLVLTAPRLAVPAELAQACAAFDWPAGGGGDLEALYEEVASEAAASAGHDVRLDPQARDTLLERLKDMPAGRARFEIARALLAATSRN